MAGVSNIWKFKPFPFLASSKGGVLGQSPDLNKKHVNHLVCFPCRLVYNLKPIQWQIYQVTNPRGRLEVARRRWLWPRHTSSVICSNIKVGSQIPPYLLMKIHSGSGPWSDSLLDNKSNTKNRGYLCRTNWPLWSLVFFSYQNALKPHVYLFSISFYKLHLHDKLFTFASISWWGKRLHFQ